MANPNAAFGLRPVRTMGRMVTQVNEYYHASGDGTALFIGDPVISNDQDTSTSSVAGIPDGTPVATASGTITTTAIRGAVTGVRPNFTNLTLQYAPASTGVGLLVADDPNQLFTIMSNGTGAVGDVGDTAGITSGSGSTTTGVSAYVLTESTAAADASDVLRIIRVAPVINNTAAAANVVYECYVNLHELRNTTTTS
jgi:hypothetical protein